VKQQVFGPFISNAVFVNQKVSHALA
jgi:hypothetical protein